MKDIHYEELIRKIEADIKERKLISEPLQMSDMLIVSEEARVYEEEQFAEFLQVSVHCLVGVIREHQIVFLVGNGPIFFKNPAHHIVDFYRQAVCCLHCRHLYVVVLDIVPFQA